VASEEVLSSMELVMTGFVTVSGDFVLLIGTMFDKFHFLK
jgi:hypothetical protein